MTVSRNYIQTCNLFIWPKSRACCLSLPPVCVRRWCEGPWEPRTCSCLLAVVSAAWSMESRCLVSVHLLWEQSHVSTVVMVAGHHHHRHGATQAWPPVMCHNHQRVPRNISGHIHQSSKPSISTLTRAKQTKLSEIYDKFKWAENSLVLMVLGQWDGTVLLGTRVWDSMWDKFDIIPWESWWLLVAVFWEGSDWWLLSTPNTSHNPEQSYPNISWQGSSALVMWPCCHWVCLSQVAL